MVFSVRNKVFITEFLLEKYFFWEIHTSELLVTTHVLSSRCGVGEKNNTLGVQIDRAFIPGYHNCRGFYLVALTSLLPYCLYYS